MCFLLLSIFLFRYPTFFINLQRFPIYYGVFVRSYYLFQCLYLFLFYHQFFSRFLRCVPHFLESFPYSLPSFFFFSAFPFFSFPILASHSTLRHFFSLTSSSLQSLLVPTQASPSPFFSPSFLTVLFISHLFSNLFPVHFTVFCQFPAPSSPSFLPVFLSSLVSYFESFLVHQGIFACSLHPPLSPSFPLVVRYIYYFHSFPVPFRCPSMLLTSPSPSSFHAAVFFFYCCQSFLVHYKVVSNS